MDDEIVIEPEHKEGLVGEEVPDEIADQFVDEPVTEAEDEEDQG